MAAGPHVAAVGADPLHLGRMVLQGAAVVLRKPLSPSCAFRATPRGSAGPPDPAPDGSVDKERLFPGAPTVYGMHVVPSVVGGDVRSSRRVARTS